MSDEKKGVLTLRLDESERAIMAEIVETFTARGLPRTGSWAGAIRHLIKTFDSDDVVLSRLESELTEANALVAEMQSQIDAVREACAVILDRTGQRPLI